MGTLMTMLTAAYEQAIGYTARVDRLGIDALFGGPGVDYGFQCFAGGTMFIFVDKGRALVARTDLADQGSYLIYNDATGVNLTLSAADPAYTRIDHLVAHIYDTALGDIKDGAYLEVITGIVNSGVAPPVPSNAISLWTISIPPGITAATSAAFTDTRIYCGPNGCPGEIAFMSGDHNPSGWIVAQGQAVSRAAYPDLFTVYLRSSPSLPYGAGDGATTFNLPDLRNRFLTGVGSSYGLGATGGESAHLLVAGETPLVTHSHSLNDPGHSHTVTDPTHNHSGFAFTTNNPASGPPAPASEWTFGAVSYANPVYDSVTTGIANNIATGVSVNAAGTGVSANNNGAAAGSAHNNLPPYIAMYGFVKT